LALRHALLHVFLHHARIAGPHHGAGTGPGGRRGLRAGGQAQDGQAGGDEQVFVNVFH